MATVGLALSTTLKTRKPFLSVRSRKTICGIFVCAGAATAANTIAANALAFMVQIRWPEGITCPYCDSTEHSILTTRRIWKCKECRKQFRAKVGTIFEDSPVGLDKWFPALWMIVNMKNGISSYELG